MSIQSEAVLEENLIKQLVSQEYKNRYDVTILNKWFSFTTN